MRFFNQKGLLIWCRLVCLKFLRRLQQPLLAVYSTSREGDFLNITIKVPSGITFKTTRGSELIDLTKLASRGWLSKDDQPDWMPDEVYDALERMLPGGTVVERVRLSPASFQLFVNESNLQTEPLRHFFRFAGIESEMPDVDKISEHDLLMLAKQFVGHINGRQQRVNYVAEYGPEYGPVTTEMLSFICLLYKRLMMISLLALVFVAVVLPAAYLGWGLVPSPWEHYYYDHLFPLWASRASFGIVILALICLLYCIVWQRVETIYDRRVIWRRVVGRFFGTTH